MQHSHAVDIANSFYHLLENLHCPANIHEMVWTLKQFQVFQLVLLSYGRLWWCVLLNSVHLCCGINF